MRLWYLSHRRPAKAQASLRIRAVSPEPSLFAHMKYRSRRRVRSKNQTSSPTGMAGHACLKNEFTKDKKYHNLMSWLIFKIIEIVFSRSVGGKNLTSLLIPLPLGPE